MIRAFKDYNGQKPQEIDLTGDGIPELVAVSARLSIFQCVNSQYQIVFEARDESFAPIPPTLVTIKDLNKDGLPELIIGSNDFLAQEVTFVRVIEWDGNTFQDVMAEYNYLSDSAKPGLDVSWYQDYHISPMFFPEIRFADLDHNGTQEIIISGGVNMWYECRFGPWRDKSLIYSWNGKQFALTGLNLTPPKYRFQAVQDADRAFLMGDYDKALDLYQQVISSNQLKAWSHDDYDEQDWSCRPDREKWPTPTPFPIDFHEYPNQAAYARYRMVLLHIVLGQLQDAQVDYNLLVSGYPNQQDGYAYKYGAVYTGMATVFWQAYQASKNIASACQQTIEFADASQYFVFNYLGNTSDMEQYWHGHQSHEYRPEDVCPFQ